MRLYWPIARTTAAALLSFSFVAIASLPAVADVGPRAALALVLAGALYTQFVEYWSHRGPMHRGLPWLENVRRNHLEHHRLFHGANFQTRDSEELNHIVGRYWVFPALFFLHYAVLALAFRPAIAVWFLLGSLLHYLAFELSHWFSHIEANAFDRAIAHIPVLAGLRAYQIEHHRIHHETPAFAFNFNPPYLGDRLYGHMPADIASERPLPLPKPAEQPALALSMVSGASPRLWQRPAARYAAVAACGIAVLGAAVLAHGRWSGDKGRTPSEQLV